ncbi:hypothetical protein JHJ32_21725 [Parapedobacter sp. ISTM3]|uniref:Lipoprotein n=1 Tax=Parapedobacter luteus TaxID=623280 RepID=A0A1T5E0Q4_9SPHI|nr:MULTISPECIES: hypothetical protein [Parapedobacter]MBK1442635.1 hypothetical protein [Parapedobacter sp. ISTM3]SKB77283.1 hypothetical protein SAMN05660226_03052 [Parapedobacter luteus]
MRRLFFSATATLLFLAACEKDEDTDQTISIHTDFSDGKDGWQGGFSEYSGTNAEIYELEEGIAPLPPPLDESKSGYRTSGINRSDDLFMYLTKRVQGLKPNTSYRGRFSLQLASNARSGGVGAGGAPGESVGLGIGLTIKEPRSAPDNDNFYRMNIDKIHQCCTDGNDMIVIGDIANGTDDYVYTLIDRSGEFTATTDHQGVLWIIVGTDSGFEGRTTLYYSIINVTLEEI